jgi:protein-serine/threonine kinase
LETKEIVAIKVLNLDTAEDDVRDVQQEIALLSQLAQVDAQNVTRYYGSYLLGSKLWIIMEYCSGGSVRTLLKAGKIEERYSAVIMREILVALQYIHKEGIIHRDIKAANVLVTKEGKIQLCDFGVATQLTSAQLKRTSMIGTPYWMAPEVIQEGTAYNQKADIWSLGITLYEITIGSPPLADQDVKRAVYMIPRSKPARLEGTQHSAALKEFVAKCLDEQPEERATAEELSKTRFIKGTRNVPTVIIRDLIARYNVWRENNKNLRDSFMAPNHGGANFTSDDEDDGNDLSDYWDFDDDEETTAASIPVNLQPPNSNFAKYGSGFNNSSPDHHMSPSQMGTLITGNDVSNSNQSVSGETSLSQPTYRPNDMDIASKHPLMDLFKTEEEVASQSQVLPPLIPLSTNTSSMNLQTMASVSEYTTPTISLDLPNALAPSQSYAPMEIEIPSFNELSARSKPRLNSATASGLPGKLHGAGSSSHLSEMVTNRMATSSTQAAVVTPHTPIKPVFSQTNLSIFNNAKNSSITGNGTVGAASNNVNTSTQKLTPHNTAKKGLSIRRTPSPKRIGSKVSSAKSSPKTNSASKSSQRTIHDSSSDIEDLQSSFDFTNLGSNTMSEKHRAASVAAGTAPDGKPDSTKHKSNLHITMPAPNHQLDPPSMFSKYQVHFGSAHSTDSSNGGANGDNSGAPASPSSVIKMQAIYNQQLLQQQQKQSHLLNLHSSMTARSMSASGVSTTGHAQYVAKSSKSKASAAKASSQLSISQQLQIAQQQQQQQPRHKSTTISIPNRFPRLAPLDCNVLLDRTPKDDAITQFDQLLGTLVSGLDVIEYELNAHFLHPPQKDE